MDYKYDFEITPAYRFALIPEKIHDYDKCFLDSELEGAAYYIRKKKEKYYYEEDDK